MKTHFIYACVTCNKAVQDAIWNSTFFPNLFTMLSAFFVLAILVIILSVIAGKRYKENTSVYSSNQMLSPVPLMISAIILGIGLGGFLDGIVFHQLLQWHEMLSNKLMPITLVAKSVNMFWDGIFNAFCFLVVLTGIFLLWRMLWRKDISRSPRILGGGLLLGWGAFNMIEGVINHHVLRLHNVREVTGEKMFWNLGFLGFAFILLFLGFVLVSKDKTTRQIEKHRVLFNGSVKKLKVLKK